MRFRLPQVSASFDSSQFLPTASYLIDSASFDQRIKNITSSVTIDTSSLVSTSSFNAYTSSINNYTQSVNNIINNVFVSESRYTLTSSFQPFTASIHTFTASINVQVSNIFISESNYTLTSSFQLYSSSINAFTASANVLINNTFISQSNYTPTSSFNLYSSSINLYTSSINTILNNIFISESNYVLTSSFNLYSSSINAYTASANLQFSNILLSESKFTFTSSFQLYSSSINSYTASNNVQISNIFISESNYLLTSSYLVDSASFSNRINSVSASGGGVTTGTFNAYTASNDIIRTNIFLSQSNYVTTSSFNLFTSSISSSATLQQVITNGNILNQNNVINLSGSELRITSGTTLFTDGRVPVGSKFSYDWTSNPFTGWNDSTPNTTITTDGVKTRFFSGSANLGNVISRPDFYIGTHNWTITQRVTVQEKSANTGGFAFGLATPTFGALSSYVHFLLDSGSGYIAYTQGGIPTTASLNNSGSLNFIWTVGDTLELKWLRRMDYMYAKMTNLANGLESNLTIYPVGLAAATFGIYFYGGTWDFINSLAIDYLDVKNPKVGLTSDSIGNGSNSDNKGTKWFTLLSQDFGDGFVVMTAGFEKASDGVNRMSDVTGSVIPENLLIAYGVNNALQATGTASYSSDIRKMINGCLSSSIHPYLINLTPQQSVDVTPYNQALQLLATEYSIPYVDIYSKLVLSGSTTISPTYYSDGIHPNQKGHNVIASVVKSALQSLTFRHSPVKIRTLPFNSSPKFTVGLNDDNELIGYYDGFNSSYVQNILSTNVITNSQSASISINGRAVFSGVGTAGVDDFIVIGNGTLSNPNFRITTGSIDTRGGSMTVGAFKAGNFNVTTGQPGFGGGNVFWQGSSLQFLCYNNFIIKTTNPGGNGITSGLTLDSDAVYPAGYNLTLWKENGRTVSNLDKDGNLSLSGSIYVSKSIYNPFISQSTTINTFVVVDTASGKFYYNTASAGGVFSGSVDTSSLLQISVFNAFTASNNASSSNIFLSQSNYTPTSSFQAFTASIHAFTASINAWSASGGGGTGSGGPVSLSSVTAATNSSSIDNRNFNIIWRYDLLSSGSGFSIYSTSSLASGSFQKLFDIQLSGSNLIPNQTTYAASIVNKSSGSTGTNVALYTEASGAVLNWAGYLNGKVNVNAANDDNEQTLIVRSINNVGYGGIKIYSNAQNRTLIMGPSQMTSNLEYLISVTNNVLALSANQIYIGTSGTPTAIAHIRASNGAASNGQLKFTTISTVPLTVPEKGVVEVDSTGSLYYTPTSSRHLVSLVSGTNPLFATSLPFANDTGYLTSSNLLQSSSVILLTGSSDFEVTDSSKGLILRSPNGTRYRLTVDNLGILTTTAL